MATELPSTFHLERYFEKYEFTTRYLLSCSDAEAFSLSELIAMADDETKKLWDELKLGYTEMIGNPLLREEIAKLHGVDKDHVLVVVPQEGIYIAMKCLLNYLKRQNEDEPFHAIAVFPAYQSLYENLKTEKCDLSYWKPSLTPKGWSFDVEELKTLVKSNTKLLVVNFPHNPTGYLPSSEQWAALVDFCKEKDIFLFSDEMYSFTNNDGTEANPSACSIYENSISLFGMSKSFAMPGLRLGWLCTKNRIIFNMMSNFKDYITICAPSPSEILSLIGLRNHKRLLQHTMGIVLKNLKLLNDFFGNHSNIFEWHPPRAGTTGFVKLKGWLLTIGNGGASAFCEKLVTEKEVLLLPAKMYNFQDEYVRIGFGRANLEECLVPLGAFIQEHTPQ